MIYLIITTSILNKQGLQQAQTRKERYLTAITETLQHLPPTIQPILVENNGKRETYLDHFQHAGKSVPVLYTNNNSIPFKSKGANELLDMKEVIRVMGIKEEDVVIKLTGRYRMMSSYLFEEVIRMEKDYDAFVKFFGTCSLKWERYDCILGCYVIRAKYLMLFSHLSIENYDSAEIAFARYVRFSGAKIKEMERLEVECLFAEDNRILIV